jgi:hypothetical protein
MVLTSSKTRSFSAIISMDVEEGTIFLITSSNVDAANFSRNPNSMPKANTWSRFKSAKISRRPFPEPAHDRDASLYLHILLY